MKKLKYILSLTCALSMLLACGDENEIFKKEQYEKLIYLISDNDQIFAAEYSLDGNGNPRALSVACSGTNPLEETVTVELEADTILLNKYNKSNFDLDSARFALKLPEDKYRIASMSVQLSGDDKHAYSLLPVYIDVKDLEMLSPDSIYFIPLAIKNVSNGYQINEDKRNVLFRIYTKNEYASTKSLTYYQMKGYRDGTYVTNSAKVLFPLTKDKVRMYVGADNYSSSDSLEEICAKSMVVQIHPDNTLTITAWKEGEDGLEVEMVTEPEEENRTYNNTYDPDAKRLLMYYRYRNYNKASESWGNWITVRELTRDTVTE